MDQGGEASNRLLVPSAAPTPASAQTRSKALSRHTGCGTNCDKGDPIVPADLVDDDNPALARVARETTPAAALAAARHKVGAYGAAS
jgi:hypothetical protein